MNNKRSHIDIDPDYEDVTDHQVKRQRVLENDAKEATVRKIESIIRCQFEGEIRQKEAEINIVDQRLNQARLLMDRLRACIVASQYSSTILGTRDRCQPLSIHPTVKKHLGKAPVTVTSGSSLESTQSRDVKPPPLPIEKPHQEPSLPKPQPISASSILSPGKVADTRGGRFKTKHKIIVGNVSKFIPLDRREVNDQSTHKWMLYVRGPKDKPHINSFVKKVWFFLHPSYKPNDLVEIDNPPYHLTRRGWGEFPVRVQLHFRDQRNKRVDIIHNLKLDKTCTGLQTLGAETVIEVELERDNPRSESPSTMNEVDSKHGRQLSKGSNSVVETTTAEDMNDFVQNSDSDKVTKLMDTEVTINHDAAVNGSHSGCHDNKNGIETSNGTETPKSNGDVEENKDNAARVIHLKTKEEIQGELCKNSKGALNHSNSSESTNSKSDVMYMRCKDQQGNLLLLPYKINPDKTMADTGKSSTVEKSKSDIEKGRDVKVPTKPITLANKSVAQTVTLANMSAPQTVMLASKSAPQAVTLATKSAPQTVTLTNKSTPTATVSTSNPLLQTVQTTLPPAAAAKPTTNLVLKVTPTGLKLVPADSDTLTVPTPPPSNSLLHSNPVAKPKLKSLLTGGPSSAFSSVKASSGQRPANSVLTTSNLPSKQISNVNSEESAKQSSNTQSLVLANIGDKHYLLKVVPQPDNQVLLVPNKQTSTPQTLSSSAQSMSNSIPRSVHQQRSLLGASTSMTQPQTEQKSLTLSFGLSPFSVQSSVTQKSLLPSANVQKTVSNNTAATSDRKIHVWKKKIKDMFEVREEVKPVIISDYPDLLSVVRAAVRRHPVVKEVVDRSVHPYCARSTEEWLSWNVGKRRSSEWQRAASVRKFIESHLKESYFKGEQLWSTRKIMTWCRLHAFSPHHLESTFEPEGAPDVSGVSDKHTPTPPVRPLSSLTDHQALQDRLDTLLTDLPVSDESEGEVDIVSVDLPKVKLKEEPMESEVVNADCEVLPPSEEAVYVQDVAQQIGVKFQPVQIESEVIGSVSEDIIYKVMSRLAEDVLREAFSVTRQSKISSEQGELKAEHVFKALNNMAATDFLSNRHLGIHDDTANQSGVR